MSLTFALAAATVVPGPATSFLVDEGHSHDWTTVIGGMTFYDRAYLGSVRAETRSFPLVLMRNLEGPEEERRIASDIKVAIDCAESAIALVEIWVTPKDQSSNGFAVGREGTGPLNFRKVYPQNEERVAPVFRHACGNGWSMEATK